jgi:iron complex outermembrane receptor protein
MISTIGRHHQPAQHEHRVWKFGAQYDVSRRTMIYATASRGYKSGQISVPAYPLTPYIVQPEIPTSYELGLKSTLFGGWVADLSLFSETIRNFQLQQCTNTSTGAISCTRPSMRWRQKPGGRDQPVWQDHA